MNEIDDRVAWFKSLEEVGAEKEYRHAILSDIAVRLKDLEFLDQIKSHQIETKHMKFLQQNQTQSKINDEILND